MPTAINNNPANISTKAIQKLAQLAKAQQDPFMIAVAEIINQLNARITGLETQEVLPDIIANSINTQEVPKIGGCPLIVTSSTAPSSVASDFAGQIYVYSDNIYMSKKANSSTDWVKLNP